VQLDSPTVHTVKAVIKGEEDIFGLAGGSLAEGMIVKEIGVLVATRLCSAESPNSDAVQNEAELTKKLSRDGLIATDGVVHRKKVKFKSRDETSRTKGESCDRIMRLLLPTCVVNIAIEFCYAGSMGGHFDMQCTRYYSGTLLEAVINDSQTCARCVGEMRVKAVEAFRDMEVRLQPNANCSSQYDDLGLRYEKFAVGEWLLGFDTCKLRRRQTNGVLQFEGPFLVVSKPVVTGSAGDISHRAMAGTNSGGQGDVQPLPTVATNSSTGLDVVDRLSQFVTVEGFCPEFVSMSGQSAV